MLKMLAAAACAGLALAPAPRAQAAELAKTLFSAEALPSTGPARSFGFYSKGCIAGAMAIAPDGSTWQVMRPSRNRFWGHPALVALIEKLSRDASAHGWPGLLVGDLGQPRGGPASSGHASHQVGLDVDIWFTPMPDRTLSRNERETMAARSLVRKGTLAVDEARWSPSVAALLKTAASEPEVERIFVHPAIKKKLCDTVKGDRSWMGKVRPFWGHDEHFHLRISCQPGSKGCKRQEAVPAGDGCDKSLAWWFTEEPWRPAKGPVKRARDTMTVASLPAECRALLAAPAVTSVAAATYRGRTAVASVPGSGEPGLPAGAAAFAGTPASAVPLPSPRPDN